jgi:hypothetical protein
MTPKEDQQPMTTREELAGIKPQKWGPGNRPFYDKALVALEAAHTACYEKHADALGMSHGPFSGVNEALGIVASLEEENQRLSSALRLASRQEVSVDALTQEIRRVDGSNSLGAAALAEALMPFITKRTTEG